MHAFMSRTSNCSLVGQDFFKLKKHDEKIGVAMFDHIRWQPTYENVECDISLLSVFRFSL